MTLEYFKENICKYCKANCKKRIEVIKEQSIICIKCVDYEPKELRKTIPSYWQGW